MPRLVIREGREIHYELEGTGPPLMLLHPAVIASSIWRDLGYVDAMRDRHRLILVDTLAYGLSSKPHSVEAYILEKQVADLEAVLRAVDVPKADVFGYSMGGVLAIAFAIMSPESVRRLVVGGAAPPGMQPPPPKDYVRPVPLDQGAEVYAKAAVDHWRSVGVELSVRSKQDLRAVDFEAVAARREAVGASDLKSRVPEIRAPSILIVGSQDPFAGAARAASAMMPDCVYTVIEGRSHIGALADNDSMVRELNQFFGDGE